ncbi:hypothetical protein GCM10023116_39980 [Kistimonas scapharcae]|uniref:SET domain-containing protein n=1 Tax=Kistimonas scapharcae TaxID=1036133 RepID=A0ABP8V6V0_9GAMM
MDLSCSANGNADRQKTPLLSQCGQKIKGGAGGHWNHGSVESENYWQKHYAPSEKLKDKATITCKENVRPLVADQSQYETTAQHVINHLQQEAELGQDVASAQRQPLSNISPLAGGSRTDLNSPVKRKAEPVYVLPSKKPSPDIRRGSESAGHKNSTLDRGQSHVYGDLEGITVSFGSKPVPGVSRYVARVIQFDMADEHGWFVLHGDREILSRLERLLEETPKSSAEAAKVFAQEHQDWVFALQYHLYQSTGIEADTLVAIYHNLARLMAGWHRHREAATLLMLLVGQLEHHPDHKKVMRSKTLMSDAFRHDCMNELMTQWLHLNNQDHGQYLNVLKNHSDVREAVAKELGISLPQCFASLAVNLRCSFPRMLENAMVNHVSPEVKDDGNVPWHEAGGFHNSMIMRLLHGAPHQYEKEYNNRVDSQGFWCECHCCLNLKSK